MTPSATLVREVPSAALLSKKPSDPARKIKFDEPELAVDNIQGCIIGGFNKSHRQLISYRINATGPERILALKKWLRAESDHVATAREVIAFDNLFKATGLRRGREGAVKSTWMALSLSFRLLAVLAGTAPFADQAFKEGLAKRSKSLGDPVMGNFAPPAWLVEGSNDFR
jgi:hypothetical protein